MRSELDFMDELEAAARMKANRASSIFLFALLGFVLFFIIWANFAPIEELTRGMGKVVPSQEIQIVQSLEGGVLQELLVQEGDSVKKGQVLMRLSDVNFASEERGTEAKFRGLQLKRARLEAESEGKPFAVPADIEKAAPDLARSERDLYNSRQAELANALAMVENKISSTKAQIAATQADIKRLQDSRGNLQQQLAITHRMVEQKAVPKMDELKLQREFSDASGEMRADQEKLPGLQADLASAVKEAADAGDKFRTQALGELTDVKTDMAQLRESLKSIGDRVYRTELRAPVDGIVNNIAIKTIGGVIEPAQKLVEIVPMDDKLKIAAKVRPSDIAFLKVGQPAKVKITAYDAQRYGRLDGKLIRIGANSTSDSEGNTFFEIEVRTERNYLGTAEHPFPITPGMVAEVQIVTGKQTIMEYILKPVLRARDVAMRER
jgi:adhesin transport system membrane fusion protein